MSATHIKIKLTNEHTEQSDSLRENERFFSSEDEASAYLRTRGFEIEPEEIRVGLVAECRVFHRFGKRQGKWDKRTCKVVAA